MWIYNKKRFQNLKHQIPASVLKNYLDAIIQNSTALKSSLMRSGSDEIDPLGIPFVMPLQGMGTLGANPNSASGLLRTSQSQLGSSSEISSEELNLKNAELANLRAQCTEKDSIIKELELKVLDVLANFREAQDKLSKLEAGGAVGSSASGNDSELAKQLSAMTNERDQYRDKLKEYEVIEHDLAEIPRLQREVDQLRKSLQQYETGNGDPSNSNETGDTGESFAAEVEQSSPSGSRAGGGVSEMKLNDSSEDDVDMEKAMKEMENMNRPSESATSPKEVEVPAGASGAGLADDDSNKAAKVDDELLSQFEKMLS